MKILHLTISIIALLLIFSCASRKNDDKASGNNEKEGPDKLTEIYWKLTEIKGKPLSQFAAQNKEPFIMLKKEGKRVEGTGGCNGMGGSYVINENNQITFSQLISTKMACNDMMLETEFHGALELTHSYQSDGNHLKLLDKDGNLLVVFEASTRQ